MKIVFGVLYILIILITLALCKTAKRADEEMEKEYEKLKLNKK